MVDGVVPAGWYSDPTEHSDERYWDGAAWTGRVRSGATESVDPLPDEAESFLPRPHGVTAEAIVEPEARGGASAPDATGGRARWLSIGVVIAFFAVIVLVIVVIASSGGEDTHTVEGTYTLIDSDADFSSRSCSGSGEFADISEGTQVKVRDASGKLLATGELARSRGAGSMCIFRFTVTDVPDAELYALEVGRRGEIRYPRKEMENMNWTVDLFLRNP